MNRQFLHILSDSFRSWVEYKLEQGGRGFRNVSGALYPTKCEYPGKYSYSNPYGSWVYDSSVSGANQVTGAYINGNFTNKGGSLSQIDYLNGRLLFNSPQSNVTATYAVKDFNVYTTSRSDYELIFDDKLQFRPKFTNGTPTGIPPNLTYGPLIYIKRNSVTNEPFALGGQDNTIANYRAIILSNNEYDIDSVGSIFLDSAREHFMLLDTPPLNRYNDLYSGITYNYVQKVLDNYNTSNLVCISDVDYYRFDARTEVEIRSNYYAGFIEFTLELPRFPRINTNTKIYPPENNLMLYYQTISIPSGSSEYDVIFNNGNNLISAEIILPNSASGIYEVNINNLSSTGFKAIFNYVYETGINLYVTTSNQ